MENTNGLGFKTIQKILEKAPTFERLKKEKEVLLSLRGVTRSKIASIYKNYEDKTRYEEYMKQMKKLDGHLLEKASGGFPERLKTSVDSPYWLHIRGDRSLLKSKKTVGIIGSRNSSPYGNEVTYKISNFMAKKGYVVISGMARGIDSYAHKGALKQGKNTTVAVLGTGVDQVYPKENSQLYMRLVRYGAVVSEYLLGTPPRKYNFPRRNRIISGLSDFIIVMEASKKSGSLITVNFALEQGKDVLAVPGEIFSNTSQGTNLLIRDGAYPITSLEDLNKYLESNGK